MSQLRSLIEEIDNTSKGYINSVRLGLYFKEY